MSTARRMTRSDMGFQKAEPSYGLPTPFRLASSSCCALPVMSRCSSREGVVWRPRTSHRVSSCASRQSTQGGAQTALARLHGGRMHTGLHRMPTRPHSIAVSGHK